MVSPRAATASPRAATVDSRYVDRVLAEGRIGSRDHAEAVVIAAQAHATADFPLELLLGLADTESDFVPWSVSRLINGERVTGSYLSTKRPAGATGNFFCGITQATASTWARCLALRDIDLAYRTTVAELTAWLKRAKTVTRALQGYGCGNKGMSGSCKAYAGKVYRRARLFKLPLATV